MILIDILMCLSVKRGMVARGQGTVPTDYRPLSTNHYLFERNGTNIREI